MALTPLDIQNKSFDTKFKGYNPDDVDDFLDMVTRDYEEAVTKNREMEKSLKHAEEKLEYFNELKDALNQSIIVAQDTGDKVKEAAKKEAEIILSTAKQEANATTSSANQEAHDTLTSAQEEATRILTEASSKAKRLATETEDLKKKTRTFHQKLRLLLEAQTDMVNNDEWNEILQPFSTFVGDNHDNVKEVLDKDLTGEVNSNQAEEISSDTSQIAVEPVATAVSTAGADDVAEASVEGVDPTPAAK